MKLLRVCFAAFLLTLATAAHAEVLLILSLDGVPGESTVLGYADKIDVAEVSFDFEQAGLLGKEAATTGASAAKAKFNPITISKGADKASPMLFLKSVLGQVIKKAKISFLTPDPTNSEVAPKEFFSITIGNVFISKFGVSAARGDDNSREEVVLTYNKILLTYSTAPGVTATKGFDLVKNKEISDIPGGE